MTEPEQALAKAQASAETMRASGAYGDDLAGFRIEPADAVSTRQLLEWAVIEPDPANLYSTRKLGAPITFVKRMVLRSLRQYLTELTAQQTRFNIQLTAYVRALTERVEALEQAAAPAPADPAPADPAPPAPPPPAAPPPPSPPAAEPFRDHADGG
jgi:hypothetical protein